MSSRSVPLSTMFGWIPRTFRLVFRAPGTLALAALLTVLVFLGPSVPLYGWMFANGGLTLDPAAAPAAPFGGNLPMFLGLYGVTLVLSLLLYPPVLAGWFRLVRALDGGQAWGATAIFAPFRDGWGRLVAFALVTLLAGLVLAGLLFLVYRGPFTAMYEQVQAVQAATAAGLPPPQAGLPDGFLGGYLMSVLALVAAQSVFFLAFIEVALRPTGFAAAIGAAASALARNLHKLLLFAICLAILGFIAMLVFVLVLALLSAGLAMLGTTAMVIGMLLLYIPFLVIAYPLVFAGNYVAWTDLLDGAPATADAEQLPA